MALTLAERVAKARNITEAMRERYEAEGVEGDFDAAEVYLRDDASDEELLVEEGRWCK
jgi:hypothetical protein